LLPIFSLAGIAKVSFSRGSKIFEHGKNLEEKVGKRKVKNLKTPVKI